MKKNGRYAHVDFIDVHLCIREGAGAADLLQALLSRQFGRHVQHAKSGRDAGLAFHTVRIGHVLPKHMVAAADADESAATTQMILQPCLPALYAQPLQIDFLEK